VGHGAQVFVEIDAKEQDMSDLGSGGHQEDDEACRGSNKSGKNDQPDLVGADEGAEGLRRVQHRFADRAMPVVPMGTLTPG